MIQIVQILGNHLKLFQSPFPLTELAHRHNILDQLIQLCNNQTRIEHLSAMRQNIIVFKHAFLN